MMKPDNVSGAMDKRDVLADFLSAYTDRDYAAADTLILHLQDLGYDIVASDRTVSYDDERVPFGECGIYASDDDVIGLPVARTYPSGWYIIRTEPAEATAFDEWATAKYLAWCMDDPDTWAQYIADRKRTEAA